MLGPPQHAAATTRDASLCKHETKHGSLFLLDSDDFFAQNPEALAATAAPAFLNGSNPVRVLLVGASGNGPPFHLHGDAWLEVLAGAKRCA